MSAESAAKVAKTLLKDVKDFKARINSLKGDEVWSTYGLEREWDALKGRRDNLRQLLATLSQSEKQGIEVAEMYQTFDEIEELIRKRFRARHNLEVSGKLAGIGTALAAGGLAVLKVLDELNKMNRR